MILTTKMLLERYHDYSDPKGKIRRDVNDGKLIQLVKGLYETNPNANGADLAQFIYNPSYISFDTVLYDKGLIPETVVKTYTCATFNKGKKKIYTNHFGTFVYRDVPQAVFPYGVVVIAHDDYCQHIATPEKAICDKLYTITPVHSVKALKKLLFEDLRINEEHFNNLNKTDMIKIAPLYKCTNLNLLIKYLKGE